MSTRGTLPRRANVIGVRVSATNYAEVTARVMAAARAREGLLVTAADVHLLIQARRDPAYAAAVNSLDIVTPDGQPVRWGLKLTRQADLPDRVYGPTLMLRVCEAAARDGLAIFLYGSLEATLERLSSRLRERFPGLRVAGTRAGRFRPLTRGEQGRDADEINGSGAAITFVGMGCPRQEWWLFHMRERVRMPALAVGAAFDFHAGLVPQAPAWMQARGLEWLYRLHREPRRLWRRYLVLTPTYVPLIAAQALGLRRFAPREDFQAAANRPCPG
jgi:N-acetylglucosaminyldiphosphoundecaprenol N-acetyl-beta-D-mannosaminyltransferase